MNLLRRVLRRRSTLYVATTGATLAIILVVMTKALPLWYAPLDVMVGGYFGLRMTLVDRRRRRTKPKTDLRTHPRVEKTLLPHEKVLVVTKEHPISILWGCLEAGLVVSGISGGIIDWLFKPVQVSSKTRLPLRAIVAGGALAFFGSYVGGPEALLLLIVAMAILVIGFSIGWRILVYHSDLLVLTNWRLYVLNGAVSRSYDIIDVDRLSGVSFSLPVMARLLAFLRLIESPYGTLKATGIGEISDRFKRTPNIQAFARALELAVHATKIEAAAAKK